MQRLGPCSGPSQGATLPRSGTCGSARPAAARSPRYAAMLVRISGRRLRQVVRAVVTGRPPTFLAAVIPPRDRSERDTARSGSDADADADANSDWPQSRSWLFSAVSLLASAMGIIGGPVAVPPVPETDELAAPRDIRATARRPRWIVLSGLATADGLGLHRGHGDSKGALLDSQPVSLRHARERSSTRSWRCRRPQRRHPSRRTGAGPTRRRWTREERCERNWKEAGNHERASFGMGAIDRTATILPSGFAFCAA